MNKSSVTASISKHRFMQSFSTLIKKKADLDVTSHSDEDTYWSSAGGSRITLSYKRANVQNAYIIMHGFIKETSGGIRIDYLLTKSIGVIIFNSLLAVFFAAVAYLLWTERSAMAFLLLLFAAISVGDIFRVPNQAAELLEKKLSDIIGSEQI